VCFCLKFKGIHSLFEKTLEKKIEKKKETPSAAQQQLGPTGSRLGTLPRSAQLPKPQPVYYPAQTVSQRPAARLTLPPPCFR